MSHYKFSLHPSLTDPGWNQVGDDDGRNSFIESQLRHGGRGEDVDVSSSSSDHSDDGGESKDEDDSHAEDGDAASESSKDPVHKVPSSSDTATWEKALRFP